MKNNFNGNKKSQGLSAILWGVVWGALTLLLLTLLFALIMSIAEMSSSVGKVFSILILAVCSFVSGCIGSKKAEEKRLILGFSSGVLMYFIVAVISMAVSQNTVTATFLLRLLICAVSSGVGAVFVTLKKSNKKYI